MPSHRKKAFYRRNRLLSLCKSTTCCLSSQQTQISHANCVRNTWQIRTINSPPLKKCQAEKHWFGRRWRWGVRVCLVIYFFNGRIEANPTYIHRSDKQSQTQSQTHTHKHEHSPIYREVFDTQIAATVILIISTIIYCPQASRRAKAFQSNNSAVWGAVLMCFIYST